MLDVELLQSLPYLLKFLFSTLLKGRIKAVNEFTADILSLIKQKFQFPIRVGTLIIATISQKVKLQKVKLLK